ncbi:TPA: hypothetical protein DEB00_02520 [Candidatus Uhrbacteria bacterium]|nr:hypothetical protein [Candidatus Uhrbacteria bacterium]
MAVKPVQKRINILWVLGAGVLLALIVVFILVYRQPEESILPTTQTIQDVLEQKQDVTTYDGFLPSQWDQTVFAEKAINQPQGKEDRQERIELGVIQDPDQKTRYYFATSDRLSDTELFLGIYQYDAPTRMWERLYKKVILVSKPADAEVYNVLGLSNGSLILQQTPLDFSPSSPCYDRLLSTDKSVPTSSGETALVSTLFEMDLQNPYGSWKQHTLPDTITAERIDAVLSCEAAL